MRRLLARSDNDEAKEARGAHDAYIRARGKAEYAAHVALLAAKRGTKNVDHPALERQYFASIAEATAPALEAYQKALQKFMLKESAR